MWHLYILQTLNDQLYTGITSDLKRRMKEHENGRGARFTRIFGFKELLYQEEHASRSLALKREAQIKSWPREKKVSLIKTQKKKSRKTSKG